MAAPVADIPGTVLNWLKSAMANLAAYHWVRSLLNSVLGPSTTPPLAAARITVGAEAANIVLITIQLVDGLGEDLKEAAVIDYYVSSDAAGQAMSTDLGTLAIGTDGTIMVEFTDDVMGKMISEADGDIDLSFTNTGATDAYLNLVYGNGKRQVSSLLDFT